MKDRVRSPDRRKRAMGALRAAAIGAALLAFAGVALPLPTRARTVVALIDLSDSIGPKAAEASREAALALIKGLGRRDRAAVATFADKALVLTPPVSPERAASILESATLSAPSPGSSDIAAGIATAKSLAEEGPGMESIYLFSDGRANMGIPPTEAAASSPIIPIYALPSGSPPSGLVAWGLSRADLVHSGERVTLTWSLFSDKARKTAYSVRVDGSVAARGEASLVPGMNEIPIAVDSGSSGRREVVVEAELPDGEKREEVRSGAYLDVSGQALVLVVSGGGGSPIAGALRAQGAIIRSGGPGLLPEDAAGYAGFAAVILDDVPALALTEGQQSSLQGYVAGGGGLLVAGGESSLGRGEYYATPLEDMLPVQTDSRQRLQFTRSKLLFVIDHSGSMSEKVGGTSKQMAAMRGVVASIDELNPLDEVAIIAFDSTPTWVLPFTPASEKSKIIASLSTLGEGGGTDLSVALDEAIKGFGAPGPTKRHAIILTDGLTPEADFAGLAAKLVAAGASASTIGIGEEVNEALLKDLAKRSGGSYNRATEDQIPSIVDKETVRMTRELIQEGRIETRVSAASPLVEGFEGGIPPVGGYLLTKAKSLAMVAVQARRADASEGWDPLLASWRYGNGRVAVFTSDSGKRWLSRWSGSSAYNRLWGQALRSVERTTSEGRLRSSATVEGGGAHVVVEAQGPDRRSLSSLRLVGSIEKGGAASGSAFDLKETAPGRYEGFAPLSGRGLVGIDVLDPLSGLRAPTWLWQSLGGESAAGGPDRAALSLIASSSGGALVAVEDASPPKPTIHWSRIGIRSPLLLLAVLLLVADLYLRSTMAGQLGRALSALSSWWISQRVVIDSSRAKWPNEDDRLSSERREQRYLEIQKKHAERASRRFEQASAHGDAQAKRSQDEED
jgi:Ca-activated chloride channel homolog